LSAASKKFEFVAPEEIRLAIHQEVEKGFSLTENNAVASAARALGFHRVTAKVKEIFEIQMGIMIEEGSLVLNNGFVAVSVMNGNRIELN